MKGYESGSKYDVFKNLNLRENATFTFDRKNGTKGTLTTDDLAQIDAIVAATAGNVYYVDSVNGGSGFAGTRDKPVTTIDAAINLCSAYDTIIVMPGHSEDITTASAIDFDVASIKCFGIGYGSVQPQVTFSDAAATVEINADNVWINNLRFSASVTVVAKGIDIKDGADDFRITNCKFDAVALTTDEFEDTIFITTSDRGYIAYNYFDMDEGSDADSAIHIVGACLGLNIIGNYIVGDYAVACIEGVTAAAEQILIQDNDLCNGVHSGLNTVACISLYTGTTGFIDNNRCYTNVSSPVTGAIVADGCFLGRDNVVSTTAETFPLIAEGDPSGGVMQSTSKTGVADEATATLWTVTGVIDVFAIVGHTETAFNSAVQVSLTTNCTDETLNATLATAIEAQVLTAAGDTISAASPGAALAATEVPGDLTPVWTSPARVTAGVIAQTIGGTPGAGVLDYTLFWRPVTPTGAVA